MTSGQSGPPQRELYVPVNVALKRLRQRAGLTGQELGRRAGMSQAKISKIETGAIHPSVEDVEHLARALGAPQEDVDRLTDQVEHSRDRMTDWRFGRDDPATWQREVAQLEAAATELHSFQPAVLSGLLQTSEYARAVLATVWESSVDGSFGPSAGLTEAVAIRLQRQQILDDPSKHFHFVIPETSLHNVLCQPDEMPGQLRRILAVSHQENVTLSMIPADERLPYPPYHGFMVLDDRRVMIDLYNTIVVTRGRSDLRLYQNVFRALASRATRDIEPILEKYRRHYLRLARER